jgi:cytolysin-activating lysine-acyltransferase
MFFRKSERKNETPAASPAPASAPLAPAAAPAASTPPPAPAPASASSSPAAASTGGTAALSPEEAKRRVQLAKQLAASFGELVMLLMHSPSERKHTLADLEWLAVPAVMNGQFALAEAQAKDTGVVTPVGALLWAFVSPEIDARLSDVSKPVMLKPDEWRSGDIPWIILAVGDKRVVGGLLEKLTQPAFKGKLPKTRLRGADGKISVGTIEVKQAAAPAA